MARKLSRTEWRVSKAGLATRSFGNRGARVRLFQKRKDGVFYRDVWVTGQGRDRKCLGTTDRVEAERLGKELIAALLRDEQIEATGSLPLGQLWERYRNECIQFLDNDPRTIADAETHAAILLGYFGSECDVRELTEQDQLAFVQKRLAGGIIFGKQKDGAPKETGPVGNRSAEVDLKLLHSMLKWATTVRVRGGKRLLNHNPLAGIKRPKEQNPRRPIASWERFQATRRAISKLIDCSDSDREQRKWVRLDMALVLAEATGRRIGSIRKLSWSDIDWDGATILWKAEHDKKRKQWKIPAPESLLKELQAFRVKLGGAFGGLLFPSESDPAQPMRRDVLGDWLESAEKAAGLPKLEGGLWHPYRRAWATSRKHLPAVDVGAAGGWSDLTTLMKCYQQADSDTLLAVMSEPKKVSERAKTG